MKNLLRATTILAVLGVAVSAYALWQHFAPFGSGFCNVSSRISCDLVNKSAYSEIVGIPISFVGIIGYTLLAGIAIAMLVRPSLVAMLFPWLLAAAIGGLGFSLYLTYVELFVIGAICVLCVTSQVLMLSIAILTSIVWRKLHPSLNSSSPAQTFG